MTMTAETPSELLGASTGEGEERHYREVFEQYIAMKNSTGESTQGQTFEKFVASLKKNRDQIMKKHGAKTVRFSVYLKDAKTALKATPVRE